MSTKIFGNKDFQKNEAQNVRVHNLGSAPSSPVTGQIYYDTGTSKLYFWNGSAWVDTGGAAGGILSSLIDAKGDLIVGTADDTAARKAVGANDTFLAAASGQSDGLQWRVLATADLQEKIATADLTDWPRVAALDLAGQKITSMADGTASTDGATFGQLNAILEGKKWKQDPAQAATTGALPNTPTYSAGAGTLTAGSNTTLAAQDGVTLAVGDTLLVKNQASSFQNGIYTLTAAGSGAAPWVLTRRADGNVFGELQAATTIYVVGGSTQGGDIYTQTATLTDLTSDTQTWTKTGDTNVVYTGTANRISVAGTVIDIDAAYVGQTSITTLGTVTTGVWTGTAVAVANGGTGATTAAGARTNLAVPGKFSGALTGGATSEVVTHNLGTRDVIVSVVNNATPWDAVEVTWEATSTNTITIRSDAGNLPASYRVVCVG